MVQKEGELNRNNININTNTKYNPNWTLESTIIISIHIIHITFKLDTEHNRKRVCMQ